MSWQAIALSLAQTAVWLVAIYAHGRVVHARWQLWCLRTFDRTREEIEQGRARFDAENPVTGWCWLSTTIHGEAAESVEEALRRGDAPR